MPIKENVIRISKEIPENITLIAATKGRSIPEIEEAVDAGIKIIGENYVQEAEEKFKVLNGKAKFHFIGHLQTNKVKKAVRIFDMIETVDSFKLAEEINKRADKIMPVLIEVNIAREQNKSGIFPEKAIEYIIAISKLKNIKIKGLMTMGPVVDDPEKIRPYFKQMKSIFELIKKLNIENVDMEILSMGMSDTYKIAIEEGANEIRLGRILFS